MFESCRRTFYDTAATLRHQLLLIGSRCRILHRDLSLGRGIALTRLDVFLNPSLGFNSTLATGRHHFLMSRFQAACYFMSRLHGCNCSTQRYLSK